MRSETVAVGCHRLRIGIFEPFLGSSICERLPPVATAWLHKCSMPVRGISDWNRAFGVNECAFFEMSTFCIERGSAALGQHAGVDDVDRCSRGVCVDLV